MLVTCARENCDNKLEPKQYRHIYCSRKCFVFSWRKNLKISKYPLFKCPVCGKVTQLDFHPVSSKKKWMDFSCDKCSYRPMGGLGEVKIIIS